MIVVHLPTPKHLFSHLLPASTFSPLTSKPPLRTKPANFQASRKPADFQCSTLQAFKLSSLQAFKFETFKPSTLQASNASSFQASKHTFISCHAPGPDRKQISKMPKDSQMLRNVKVLRNVKTFPATFASSEGFFKSTKLKFCP